MEPPFRVQNRFSYNKGVLLLSSSAKRLTGSTTVLGLDFLREVWNKSANVGYLAHETL